MLDRDNLSDDLRKIFDLAQQEARRLRHNYVGTEHLLLGLLRDESAAARHLLKRLGVDVELLRSAIEFIVGRGDSTLPDDAELTPRANNAIEFAKEEVRNLGHAAIRTEHVLLGLLRERESVAAGVLESFRVRLDDARRAVVATSSGSTLREFGTALPIPGDVPVVAREPQIERLIEVLLRRSRHHPMLVGGQGSGRMSVVRGLAARVAEAQIPVRMPFRRIVVFDVAHIDALPNALTEAKTAEVLLCLSDVERLPEDTLAQLLSAISHTGVRVVGLTTPIGFDTLSAQHPAVTDLFEPVLVPELSVEQTKAVLEANLTHSVSIRHEAVGAASELAERYLTDRLMPRSALDLLDEAVRQTPAGEPTTAEHVRAALARWTTTEDFTSQAPVDDALRRAFVPEVAEVLVKAYAQKPTRALLVLAAAGAHTHQFTQSLADALFSSAAALVELDLSADIGHLATYPPGRVWFSQPTDTSVAEALRRRPATVLRLSHAEHASPAALDLAEYVLRTGQVTDPEGRRLDLTRAVIVVSAARGARLDPRLLRVLPMQFELTRAWSAAG